MSGEFRGRKLVEFLLYLYLNEVHGGNRSLAEIGRLSGYKGPGGYYDALNSLLYSGFIKEIKGNYMVTARGKRFLRVDSFLKSFLILGTVLILLGAYSLFIILQNTYQINVFNAVLNLGLSLVILGVFLVSFHEIYYWIEFTKKM